MLHRLVALLAQRKFILSAQWLIYSTDRNTGRKKKERKISQNGEEEIERKRVKERSERDREDSKKKEVEK